MRFEIGQIWHYGADKTVQAKVIAVTDDGLHATLRRITHGLGTFQLSIAECWSAFKNGSWLRSRSVAAESYGPGAVV